MKAKKPIMTFWANSKLRENLFYVVYWYPNLKYPVVIRTYEQPTTGEKLW